MKIGLIDDELEARNNLKALLSDYCKDFTIIGEADGVKSGLKLLKEVNPDVIFLDIKMIDGTGFDLLDLIPSPKFRIIFVTAFDTFAIKAFKYSAIDYLLKPINPKDLIGSVERIKSWKNQTQPIEQIKNLIYTVKNDSFQTIILSTQEGLYYIKLEDIMWIKAEKNYSTFHLQKGEEIIVSKSLGEYAKILPKTFFRSHQSYIIQLSYVHQLSRKDGNVILKNRQTIPISRRKKDEFIDRMNEFYNSRL